MLFEFSLRLRLDSAALCMKRGEFTDKILTFIREYQVDLNASAAAQRAGYGRKWARTIANQILNRPHVRAELRRQMEKRARKLDLKAEYILNDLREIAHSDRSQAFSIRDGVLHATDTDLLPESLRRCISKVSQTQFGVKIEFDDRLKALEMLGRHLSLFHDALTVNDRRARPLEEMTEEEIDEELARLEDQKATGSQKASASTNEPA